MKKFIIKPIDKQGVINGKLKEIVNLINKASRPVIYAGHGCTLYRVVFEWFIEEMNIPVMLSWRAIDLLPADHLLFAGRPGLIAQPEANKRLMKSDLVLILGARLDDSVTCYNIKGFAPKAKKVIVDIDNAELDRLPDDYIKVNMDVKDFMKQLYEAMDD
jgi:acetolactate synthase-1/2/3 large subunit